MSQLTPQFYGIAAAVLNITSFLPYLFDILKRRSRPSGPSWWTWTILTIVTVASSWTAGAPIPVLILPLWLCLNQFIVAILSIKYGDNNWDKINVVCIAAAVVGIILWLVTGQPLIVLGISVAADLLASIPNFRHVWANPEQESRLAWTMGWLSAVVLIFAISTWSLAESGWAIYFVLNMTVTILLIWRPVIQKLFNHAA